MLTTTMLLAAMTGATAQTRPALELELTGTVVVLNKAEASASLLDASTGRQVARVRTGDGPHEVAISPDGRTAVVADYGRRQPGHTLTVIDLPAKEAVRTIELGHHRPHGIEYLADGRRVVVTAEQEKAVVLADVVTGRVVRTFETGQDVSHMLALSEPAARVFVANIRSGSVSVIDLETGEAIAHVETGEGAEGIALAPDGREVWVSNRAADTLTVLDAASLEVLETVACASFPIRVKFTPDGRRVLVSNARSGEVAVFDAASRREVARIPMREKAVDDTSGRLFGDRLGEGPIPVGILVEPGGRYAFVANTNADVVTVLDLRDLVVAGRLVAGQEPDGLGYTPLVLD